jgi:hypothetical protein
MLLVGSALKGYVIQASDGEIGVVSDLLFDDTTWKLRWVVVDTGTWLATRKVLLHPSAVAKADHDRQELSVSLTKQQIEDSPDIFHDQPVSQRMENSLYDYYGWDPLWGGGYFGGGAMASPLSPPSYFGAAPLGQSASMVLPRAEEGDPHLRSIAAVNGYHIHATDGDIGHVENFLLDDTTWSIRYLIVDTRNWWPGQHVLVSPYAVREIDWAERHIVLDVTRAQVKDSPPWDPVAMIDTYYEKRLHRHYGWQGYGW